MADVCASRCVYSFIRALTHLPAQRCGCISSMSDKVISHEFINQWSLTPYLSGYQPECQCASSNYVYQTMTQSSWTILVSIFDLVRQTTLSKMHRAQYKRASPCEVRTQIYTMRQTHKNIKYICIFKAADIFQNGWCWGIPIYSGYSIILRCDIWKYIFLRRRNTICRRQNLRALVMQYYIYWKIENSFCTRSYKIFMLYNPCIMFREICMHFRVFLWFDIQ